MSAFSKHFSFEFKAGLRNPSLFFVSYLFPLGFFVLMGLIMTKINPLFAPTMIPAMVIFAALTNMLMGLPGPLVDAREAGVFRSFKINGVPAVNILFIPVLTMCFHALIVAVIITVVGPLLQGLSPERMGAYALVTLLSVFSFGAIGALIGVVAGNSRSAMVMSQIIFVLSMLIGGLMVPLTMLPASIRPLTAFLPTTYAMQAYIGWAYGQETMINPGTAALILLVGGCLAMLLSVYLFNWDSRNLARRGHPLLALLALAPFCLGAVLIGLK